MSIIIYLLTFFIFNFTEFCFLFQLKSAYIFSVNLSGETLTELLHGFLHNFPTNFNINQFFVKDVQENYI